MTEDEFIDGYCARSGVSRGELASRRVAVPCDCGDPACPGWMMIPGPDMLAGPRYTVPQWLTSEQLVQYMNDVAAGKIEPDPQQ
jgi:hypothetical protein